MANDRQVAPDPRLSELLEKWRTKERWLSSRCSENEMLRTGDDAAASTYHECADELAAVLLGGTPQPSEQPIDHSGQGRFLLNGYGMQCYDLGYEAAKSAACGGAASSPTQKDDDDAVTCPESWPARSSICGKEHHCERLEQHEGKHQCSCGLRRGRSRDFYGE